MKGISVGLEIWWRDGGKSKHGKINCHSFVGSPLPTHVLKQVGTWGPTWWDTSSPMHWSHVLSPASCAASRAVTILGP